jgi:hypothetical protein
MTLPRVTRKDWSRTNLPLTSEQDNAHHGNHNCDSEHHDEVGASTKMSTAQK